MFKSIVMAAFAVLAFSGAAEARPDTRNMTCSQAVEFVRRNSPVVLNYGYSDRAGSLYALFQTTRCGGRPQDGRTSPGWVPTLDSPSCLIGYKCN